MWGISPQVNLWEGEGQTENSEVDRYDCREGVIDWDHQISIKPHASIIHPIQFREWRLSGKAFEFGGASYVAENCSLINQDDSINFARTRRIDNIKMDVLTGPFFSIGTACDRNDVHAGALFEIHSKGTGVEQHCSTTTDVALYNITKFMWQTSTKRKYEMKIKGDVLSGLGAEDINSPPPGDSEDEMKISIVPVRDIRKLFKKQYGQMFDTVFVSNGASSVLQGSAFYELFKGNSSVVAETCRFDLSKSETYKDESIKNIREILTGRNGVEDSGTVGDTILTFKFES